MEYEVPEIPATIPVITIPSIQLTRAYDLAALKTTIKPVTNDRPLTFEELNQGNGYVLYSKKFTQPISGKLQIKGLRDYATVYVNGERVGMLNRYYKNYSMVIDIPFNATLEILVENMGRINYGSEIINNLKGIVGSILIDSNVIAGNWNMYQLPLDTKPALTMLATKNTKGRPTFYHGNFTLSKTGDTFLDMRKWGKGIVYVNGHHLGRYWSVGPQQTLYVPGVWLKKGINDIVVFEQLNDVMHTSLQTIAMPILEELKTK